MGAALSSSQDIPLAVHRRGAPYADAPSRGCTRQKSLAVSFIFFSFFLMLHVGMREEEEEGGAFSSGDTFTIGAVPGRAPSGRAAGAPGARAARAGWDARPV